VQAPEVGHPEIFAVADVAAAVDGALPQLAQPAIQGGRHAATQIRRLLAGQPTEPMVCKVKAAMATIGRNAAVATLANLSVRYLAWPGRLNVIVGDPP
jgi:NADH:ubiquinone reductase (H+-translocating)